MANTPIDRLSKALAGPAPRRRVLAAFAGALLAGPFRRVSAAGCRATGSTCRENTNCCSGLCAESDRTGRRRCACTPEGGSCVRSSGQCCGDLVCAGSAGGGICRTNGQPFANGYSFNHVVNTFSDLDCVPVWMNGSDPDGDALTFRVTKKPTFGSLRDRSHPEESQSKRALCYSQFRFNQQTVVDFGDQFAFTASDPYGATSKPAIVRIFVDERIP
jgi:hypothetical protein